MRSIIVFVITISLAYLGKESGLSGSAEPLWSLGCLLILASAVGSLLGRVKLPLIAGYAAVGIVLSFGPVGIVSRGIADYLSPLLALSAGWIAMHIGAQLYGSLQIFRWRNALISLLPPVASFLVTTVLLKLIFAELPTPLLLLLGTVASVLAPFAIFSLQSGGASTALLAFISLGTVTSFIVWSIVVALVRAEHIQGLSPYQIALPSVAIFGSLPLGLILGEIVGTFYSSLRRPPVYILPFVAIFLSQILSQMTGTDHILASMLAGIFAERRLRSGKDGGISLNSVFQASEPVTQTFLVVTFGALGAQILTPSPLYSLWKIGLVYVISSSVGRAAGGFIASRMLTSRPLQAREFLIGCLPQGVVAFHLITKTHDTISEISSLRAYSDIFVTTATAGVLIGTLIFSIPAGFLMNSRSNVNSVRDKDELQEAMETDRI